MPALVNGQTKKFDLPGRYRWPEIELAAIVSFMKRKTHKQCKNCLEIKKIDDFYENKFSPDGRYSFCKICFDVNASPPQQTAAAQLPQPSRCARCHLEKPFQALTAHAQSTDSTDLWCEDCRSQFEAAAPASPPPAAEFSTAALILPEPAATGLPARETDAEKDPEPEQTSAADILSEVQGLILEPEPQLPASGQGICETAETAITIPDAPPGIKEPQIFVVEVYDPDENQLSSRHEPDAAPRVSRTRKCNGCHKVEPVLSALKVMIPVHAWFCKDCETSQIQRYVRRGSLIQDERGNIYKITTVLSHTLVRGVIQHRDGTWDRKKVNIYGNWKTRKRKKIKYAFFTLK